MFLLLLNKKKKEDLKNQIRKIFHIFLPLAYLAKLVSCCPSDASSRPDVFIAQFKYIKKKKHPLLPGIH